MIRKYSLFPKGSGFFSGLSITNQLILANILFYIISYIIIGVYGNEVFLNNLALTPSLILSGGKIWTFLTSMFLHGGFFHLFANMFSLFFVGNFLERIIGRKRFISIYLFSGLIGGLFFVISGMVFSNDVPGVGASGAIFGILGVLAVLVPYSKIYLIVGPLIVLILMSIFGNFFSWAYFVGNILILLMIFSLFSWNPNTRKFAIPVELPMWLLPIIAIVPLVILEFFIDLPIGNSAHIGGLFIGLIYAGYLRNKFPRKTKMIQGHFR